MIGYVDEFGLKARAVMLLRGITMQKLADDLGISISYVSDILRGARTGKKYREKIGEYLGMDEQSKAG